MAWVLARNGVKSNAPLSIGVGVRGIESKRSVPDSVHTEWCGSRGWEDGRMGGGVSGSVDDSVTYHSPFSSVISTSSPNFMPVRQCGDCTAHMWVGSTSGVAVCVCVMEGGRGASELLEASRQVDVIIHVQFTHIPHTTSIHTPHPRKHTRTHTSPLDSGISHSDSKKIHDASTRDARRDRAAQCEAKAVQVQCVDHCQTSLRERGGRVSEGERGSDESR
jgi:hypothetical protein